MTITLIRYEETFPTGIEFKNIRLVAEATVDGDVESLTECYQILKTEVNEAAKRLNPTWESLLAATNQLMANQSKEPSVTDYKKEELKDIINDCTTVEELERNSVDAKKYNLNEEYNRKKEELITKTLQS